MNIRDYRIAEPLLQRFEELTADIAFIKKEIDFLIEKDATYTLSVVKETQPANATVTMAAIEESEAIITKMFPGFNGRFYIQNTETGETIKPGDKIKAIKEKKEIEVSATAMILVWGTLLEHLVEQRKNLVTDLKKLGLTYK